ncbi:MAG: LPXTG cell wall anchor domain-containing protein [Oscillospiraceae bacterium]|nr:LPXTG cell wall anchor domain-containing protein [Oscillospiraceae bacterium]
MKHRKILSAMIAITMLSSMQAVIASAEEIENNANEIEAVDLTEAPATIITTEQVLATTAVVVTTEATTEVELTDAPTNAPDEPTVETTTVSSDSGDSDLDITTAPVSSTIATTATTSNDVISADLKAPEIGNFKISSPDGEEFGNGDSAVISWNAVDGADGYQIYRTEINKGQEDIPISYTFDVKSTSYQTGDSTRQYKETIKVRAFKLVDGERVYSPWSAERTVYMNGMEEAVVTTTGTTTTAIKTTTTTTKSTTTTVKSTTSNSKNDDVEASPKTGDNIIKIAIIGIIAAVLVAIAIIASKKKKD